MNRSVETNCLYCGDLLLCNMTTFFPGPFAPTSFLGSANSFGVEEKP